MPLSLSPLDRLSRSERRAWRTAERRVQRQHETEQMIELCDLAAAGHGVTGVHQAAAEPGMSTAAVEMIIDGRRLKASRVHRSTAARLREAAASIASVPLTAVSRYGSYWVLTFKLAAEPLVVLVDQLTLVPDWGGSGFAGAGPDRPLAQLVG